MAFTPSRDPTALQESADAFVATVARLSGVPLRAQVASDYAGVIEALRSRRVDLAFVHPVGYVLARREAGCEILVRDVWENRTAYKASFYVREASGIKRLEELRGRTVAFVDPASSSGYIYPMVLLMKRGLVRDRDPKTFFKDALFAGTHEAALRAVLDLPPAVRVEWLAAIGTPAATPSPAPRAPRQVVYVDRWGGEQWETQSP